MKLWKFSAVVIGLMVVACGGTSGTVSEKSLPEGAGTLVFPLVASASDGTAYKLVGVKFDLTGPQNVTVTDTSEDTVETTLLAGDYTVQLGGTWHLESVSAPGTVIPAQLLSPNPLPFSVIKEQTTTVRFQFKIPGKGTADVGITVDSGGWLAGTLHFTSLEMPGAPSPFAELVGKDVPFLISFESPIINRWEWSKNLDVETGPITVQFGGTYSPLLSRIASSFKGTSLFFSLRPESGDLMSFSGAWVDGPGGFMLEIGPSGPIPGMLDEDGIPLVQSFGSTSGITLRSRDSNNGVMGSAEVNGQP